MDKKIGTVRLGYNDKGDPVRASFDPVMALKGDDALLDTLKGFGSPPSIDIVTQQAGLVFGAWMVEFNDLDMADRQKYQIIATCVASTEHANGSLKDIEMEVMLKEIHTQPKTQDHGKGIQLQDRESGTTQQLEEPK